MHPDSVLRLSPSAIRAFRACPYSYALGYVQPLPQRERRPITALALGSAVHEAIARFLRVGGWARRGQDELMAMLTQAWKPAAFPDPASEAVSFEWARELIAQFFEHPFPPDVERELGVEQSLAWSRPRRGVLAAGRLDRVCLRPGGVLEAIDYKTGHPPRDRDRLHKDVQALFYRSLAADSFRWLAPARTVVSFRYIGAAVTVTVEFDPIEFLDAWEDILAGAEDIRLARLAVAAGAAMSAAFPLYRGEQCSGCQFSAHCSGFEGLSAAATKGGNPA